MMCDADTRGLLTSAACHVLLRPNSSHVLTDMTCFPKFLMFSPPGPLNPFPFCCDIFFLRAFWFLYFSFSPLSARRFVRPALRLLSRRKGTAVVYQHRSVTSISKQPFHVVKWICHARELQLNNEACAIQQEVRRKSTQELLL